MLKIISHLHTIFCWTIIFLNLITILGIIICKFNYKKPNNTNFMANWSMITGICFIAYTACLAIFSMALFYIGQNLWGFLILTLTLVPYIIGNFSNYQKADLFINLQIFALLTNMIILFGKFYL